MYLATDADLEDFVGRAANSSYLAIDTEFLREKTYYARVCLLQFATEDEIVIVDPLRIKDLTPLGALMTNESITKILHAGFQDIEIIYRCVKVMPRPVFDTQIAAAVLGYPQQSGYASLVQSVCGVTLKKADSFSDWSLRPLSESQVEYAQDDVAYLPKLYRKFVEQLTEKGRLEWVEKDFEELSEPSRYEVDPNDRYLHLKRLSHLTRRQICAARYVAAWRERTAQKRDIPRKWVMTDEQIVEACRREPKTIDELFVVRNARDKLPVRDARTVVKMIQEGLTQPEEEWPCLQVNTSNEKNVDIEINLMLALVRLRARENNIAAQTLASHEELVKLARGYTDGLEVLRGWRRTIIGEELTELLAGKISLRLREGLEVSRD